MRDGHYEFKVNKMCADDDDDVMIIVIDIILFEKFAFFTKFI